MPGYDAAHVRARAMVGVSVFVRLWVCVFCRRAAGALAYQAMLYDWHERNRQKRIRDLARVNESQRDQHSCRYDNRRGTPPATSARLP